MFILQLNPVTANAECVVPVCRAETKEALEKYLEDNRVEPYKEGSFRQAFAKESLLHNFNPPDCNGEAWIGAPAIVPVGTEDEWAETARVRHQELMTRIPEVS